MKKQQQQNRVGFGLNSSSRSLKSCSALVEQSKKCTLTRILLYADSTELLEMARLAANCLLEERIYCPSTVGPITNNDNARTGFMIEAYISEGNPHNLAEIDLHRKGFIVECLWLSNIFVSKFCPPVDEKDGKFLIDPEKLDRTFRRHGSWFFKLFAAYVQRCSTVRDFVSRFTLEWTRDDPWANMDIYAETDPSQKSIEHLILEGAQIKTNSDELLQMIYSSRKHRISLPYEYEPDPSDADNKKRSKTAAKLAITDKKIIKKT